MLATALGVILALGAQLSLENGLGRRRASGLLIGVAIVLVGVAGFERASPGSCFFATAFAGIELRRARSAFPSESGGMILRGLVRLAEVLAGVAAALWVVSLAIARWPPEHILDWTDSLERAARWIEVAEKFSTAALIALISSYFLLLKRARRSASFEFAWHWTARARVAIGWASMLMFAISCFGFVAGTGDGPLTKLEELKARSVARYNHAIWRIELDLRAHALARVVDRAYDASPPEVKSGLSIESEIAKRAMPTVYYRAHYSGASANDLFAGATKRDTARMLMPDKIARLIVAEHLREQAFLPPAGMTISRIEATDRNATRLEQEEPAPESPAGVGGEIVKQIVQLGVTADRISVLKLLSAQFPITGKVLEVVLEPVQDRLAADLRTIAKGIADERSGQTLTSLRDRVRLAAVYIEGRFIHQDAPDLRWKGIQETARILARDEANALERFTADLKRAIEAEHLAAMRRVAQFQRITGKREPADLGVVLESDEFRRGPDTDSDVVGRTRDLLKSSEISIERLRAENRAKAFAEMQIGDAVYRRRAEHSRFEEILGDDLARFEEQGRQNVETRQRIEVESRQRDRAREGELGIR
jgi:hypothetical protein